MDTKWTIIIVVCMVLTFFITMFGPDNSNRMTCREQTINELCYKGIGKYKFCFYDHKLGRYVEQGENYGKY